MTTLFITFGLFSPWLIWNSYLLYFTLVNDKSFNLIIISKNQIRKYWTYILTLLGLSVYIFLVRLNNIGRSLDIYKLWENIILIVKNLSWSSLLGFGIFALLLLAFWILLTKLIFQYLKQCILALYLYYFQYDIFRNICYWFVDRRVDYRSYLIRRVNILIKNPKICGGSMTIWPWAFERLERNIYFFILPYVLTFDIIIQHGVITKIFCILPWYYIYTLFRLFWYIFDKLFTRENNDLSEEVYGMR